MRLEKASFKAIRYACLNFHYAKSVPVNTFGYSVFNNNDEWCGVVLFGSGANNNIGKQFDLKQGQIIELVRVALNGKQKTTSQVVSRSIKFIKKDLPLCRMIISYADVDQSHKGTIYQAMNWYFVGTSMKNKSDGSFIINGKRIHGKTISDKCKRYGLVKTLENIKQVYNTNNVEYYITKGKIKYLMPLDDEMRIICEKIKKEYPKTAAEA